MGDRILDGRMAAGMLLILESVVLITTGRAAKAVVVMARTVPVNAERRTGVAIVTG